MSVCFTCESKQFSMDLAKAAWNLSSATSLDEAKTVSDPPSIWAGRIMEAFHGNGHDFKAAVREVSE